jgi:hypothetical protein
VDRVFAGVIWADLAEESGRSGLQPFLLSGLGGAPPGQRIPGSIAQGDGARGITTFTGHGIVMWTVRKWAASVAQREGGEHHEPMGLVDIDPLIGDPNGVLPLDAYPIRSVVANPRDRRLCAFRTHTYRKPSLGAWTST